MLYREDTATGNGSERDMEDRRMAVSLNCTRMFSPREKGDPSRKAGK